jgi:queuine tRNA-ribosyltransferase
MFTLRSETQLDTTPFFQEFRLKLPFSSTRLGILETPHGKVETPAFMPVATKGTVKLTSTRDLEELGVQALISNAFLLSLKPGPQLLADMGGAHGFMNWGGCLFADSGGFQMLRGKLLQKISDEGIKFRSPYDGKSILIGPEDVVDINAALGSDVAMMLDHVPKAGSGLCENQEALRRTLKWAGQGLDYFRKQQETGAVKLGQQFFCITQGGIYPGLREICIREMNKLDFDGYGIGGLCIGEAKKDMFKTIALSDRLIPREKMRYLMGVGKPSDIIRSVALGIDIFDSVFPTRNARHRTFFCGTQALNIRNVSFARDKRPLEPDCECPTCQRHSRSYIHHLYRSEEHIWMRLITIHNIHYMMRLMKRIRQAIREDSFLELAREYGVW